MNLYGKHRPPPLTPPHREQKLQKRKGLPKGKCIGENTPLFYVFMYNTEVNNSPGFLSLLTLKQHLILLWVFGYTVLKLF